VKDHLDALGLIHAELKTDLAAVKASVDGKDELDALVAYTQWLGTSVQRRQAAEVDLALANPVAGRPDAIARGKKLFADNCAVCHGDDAEGQEGVAPSLVDEAFLGATPDLPDAAYFAIISGGSDAKPIAGRAGAKDGGMTAFGGQLSKEDIWSVIAWVRAQKAHEKAEGKVQ
jgi:cytochrome c oxidase cbb3-type subunit 2